jgi:auxin responsive GH3 family protein
LLISEIEPGNRYELVCTVEAGLVRYRMGDIINCTRLFSRAEDLVPLPSESVEIPRIPLISIGYRVGNLLDIIGEKTSEQNLLDALKQTISNWKEQGIHADICDFTCYPKLDAFPPQYIIFLELSDERKYQISHEQLQLLRNTVDAAVDEQLRKVNFVYDRAREAGYLDLPKCILVRSGTFSTFLHEKLLTNQVSPTQVKPHRLLKNVEHIQFFYDNQIESFSP